MPALYPIYDCQSGEGLESFGGTFGSPRSGCLAARRCADAKYGAAKRLARALGVPMEDLEEEE